MTTLHTCTLCGFTDKQDDIIQNESGEYVHAECEKDALDGERHRKQVEEYLDGANNQRELDEEQDLKDLMDEHFAPSEGK